MIWNTLVRARLKRISLSPHANVNEKHFQLKIKHLLLDGSYKSS